MEEKSAIQYDIPLYSLSRGISYFFNHKQASSRWEVNGFRMGSHATIYEMFKTIARSSRNPLINNMSLFTDVVKRSFSKDFNAFLDENASKCLESIYTSYYLGRDDHAIRDVGLELMGLFDKFIILTIAHYENWFKAVSKDVLTVI